MQSVCLHILKVTVETSKKEGMRQCVLTDVGSPVIKQQCKATDNTPACVEGA